MGKTCFQYYNRKIILRYVSIYLLSQIANVRGILVARRANSRLSANEWHYREGSRMSFNATHTNSDAYEDCDVRVQCVEQNIITCGLTRE